MMPISYIIRLKIMKIFNKRAKFDYKLDDERFEAGLSLSGGEAKAIRTGHLDLSGSVARIVGGEAWLINANVPVLGSSKYDSKRSRKLLLHKNEIVSIGTKVKQQKLTLLPVAVYTKGRFVKAELALAKPKKEFEKREDIKRKDIERDLAQELRVKD